MLIHKSILVAYENVPRYIGGNIEKAALMLVSERRRAGWYPQIDSSSIEGLLAEYFKIDLKKVSDEKDAIYEWMRKQNEIQTSS